MGHPTPLRHPARLVLYYISFSAKSTDNPMIDDAHRQACDKSPNEEAGKQAIHMGGATQLLFGIKGGGYW